MKNEGYTNREIGSILELNFQSVKTAMKRHNKISDLPPKEVQDRSSLAGPLGFNLKRIVREQPWLTYEQLSEALRPFCGQNKNPPSRESVRRFLVKNGIIRVELSKKPLISPTNRLKRIEFSKNNFEKGPEFWGRVVWSDETMIKSNPKHQKQFYKLHSSIPRKNRPVNSKSQNEGPSVMFWGCFYEGGLGPLVPIEGKLNSEKYIKLLEEYFIPFLRRESPDLIFMQDNSPVHTSRLSSQFLRDQNIETLSWPPQSPDLNPIENLWSILKRKRTNKFGLARTKDELIDQVQQIWSDFQTETRVNLSHSIKKRLPEVLKNKGGPIDY